MLLTTAIVASSLGLAQDLDASGLDAQLFRPSVDASTLLGTDDSHVPDELAGTGRLLLQWAHDPLVYYADNGTETDLVGELFQLHVLGSVAWNRLRLGVDLPVVLRSLSDLEGGETGLSDLGLDFKGRVLDRRANPVGIALASRITLPTATTQAPLGSGGLGWTVEGILDAQLGDALLALNLGTQGTPTVELENLTWDDQLFARLGASYAINPALGLGAELLGRAPYADIGNGDARPVEGLLGGWLRPVGGDWVLRLGGGSGLTGGVGAPKARVLLALAYDPPQAGPDRDLDGLVDARDDCPDDPEDIDAWEDQDGCPEPTRVTVKVVDQHDLPIDAASVRLAGQGIARQGTAGQQLDLDAGSYDVVVDAADFGAHEAVLSVPVGAPYEALVRLHVVPQEGLVSVQVKDKDGDALDAAVAFGDKTPELTHGGAAHATLPGGSWTLKVESEGYHPLRQEVTVRGGEEVLVLAVLEPELVQLTQERIEIKDSVYFETAKATIKPESYGLLNQVADVLRDHPELQRVRIEGHTDSRGGDSYNLELSQERAASVREYLIGEGIAAKRLSSIGYGETRPLDARENEAAWSQNRRVDFWIEERSN